MAAAGRLPVASADERGFAIHVLVPTCPRVSPQAMPELGVLWGRLESEQVTCWDLCLWLGMGGSDDRPHDQLPPQGPPSSEGGGDVASAHAHGQEGVCLPTGS